MHTLVYLNNYMNQFSSAAFHWVLGIELKSLGFVPKPFYHAVISLGLEFPLKCLSLISTCAFSFLAYKTRVIQWQNYKNQRKLMWHLFTALHNVVSTFLRLLVPLILFIAQDILKNSSLHT